jgi:hypothetical protein
VLEAGHLHRQCRSECRQQHDLDLERLLDAGTPRKAEYPLLVDDRHLEVVAVVDLDNRRRAAAKRVCDQPAAVSRHSPLEVELEPDAVFAVADHAPAVGHRVQEGEPSSRLGILARHRDATFREAAAMVGDLAADVAVVDLH